MPRPICPDCGKELPVSAPAGMCPNCLLSFGVAAAGGGPPGQPTFQVTSHAVSSGNSGGLVLEQPGARIGRYKLLEPIGEGGFGTVWMAEQEEPVRRRVALKIIKLGMDTKEVIARFEAERQALALMDHPNIARVFDGGATENGRPYFVMELVKGVRITDYCDAQKLDTEQRLKLFMDVCEAVQHAHHKGIIHRDLKPSNVLVTVCDDQAVVKVIDFGIAKATGAKLTDKTFFTGFNQVIGTPVYMSPEQAGLGSLDIDTRSDIYALGVLLYELLTGHTPFSREELAKAGLDEILRTIREKEPPKPSTRLSTLTREDLLTVAKRRTSEPGRLNRTVRGDLDWIVMKCLEKDRARRYETANGLAADLRRHLENEPVVARSPGVFYRFQKAVRRNQLAFAAAACVALALVAGVVVSSWQAIRATRAEREQVGLRQREEREHKLAQENLYFADIRTAYHDWESGQISRMLESLRRHVPEGTESDLRGWEWYYLLALSHREERLMSISSASVNAISRDPSGHRLASASRDYKVRIWDTETGALAAELNGHTAAVNCVAWSPDGRQIASGDDAGQLILWDSGTWQARFKLDCEGTVQGVAWRADGQRVAASGRRRTGGEKDGLVTIWDTLAGTRLHYLVGNVGLVRAIAWHPNGRTLVAGENYTGQIQVWNADNGELLRTFRAHGHAINSLAWHPDGSTLASVSRDQTIKIWDVDTWTPRSVIASAHHGVINSVAWSPDGQRLVTGGADNQVRTWNASDGSMIEVMRGHEGPVTSSIWWGSDGRFASASADGTLRVWDLRTSRAFRTVTQGSVCAWSPTGRQFAADNRTQGAAGDSINIVDAENWRTLFSLSWPGGEGAQSIAWSPDGHLLAVGFFDSGSVRIWDLASRSEIFSVTNVHEGGFLRTVAWSPDSSLLASAGEDGAVRIWNVNLHSNLLTFRSHSDKVGSAIWHPDGQRMASKSFQGELLIWRADTGQVLRQLRCPGGHVADLTHGMSWNAAGDRLAAGSGDGTIRVWDINDGREILVLKGHTSALRTVHWSPDGRRLASTAEDRTVRIWDAHQGRELLVLPCPNAIPSVSWDRAGRMLGVAGGTTLIYDATLGYDLAPKLAPGPTGQINSVRRVLR